MGIHLAHKLREILPQRFEIRELSTAGLDLIEAISGYDKAILIDAIRTPKGMPGQVYHLSLQDFRYSSNLSSTHAFHIKEALELGRRLMNGEMPDKVEILAVETPHFDEFSEDLSPELKEQFDKIVDKVRRKIYQVSYC